MSAPNGHANESGSSQLDTKESPSPGAVTGTNPPCQFLPKQIQEFVAELEVPFDPDVIDWRVTNTTKINGSPRGQVIPYADQRAYTDRLNRLFSPAGWTRRYTIHTSANFQRGEDEKTVAKVFVTCELTIFGLGSHSATGEEWADDANAVTSAEAQAFKRACACFGLGRYLYYFSGTWVDLDNRKRLTTKPELVDWATPEGWRKGLRPHRGGNNDSSHTNGRIKDVKEDQALQKGTVELGERDELVHRIESMAEPLGRGLYRGLLKSVARVWKPSQVQEGALLHKLLKHMQSAERGLRRLDAALDHTGPESLRSILRSLDLKSIDQVNDLETLHDIVVALEAREGRES